MQVGLGERGANIIMEEDAVLTKQERFHKSQSNINHIYHHISNISKKLQLIAGGPQAVFELWLCAFGTQPV